MGKPKQKLADTNDEVKARIAAALEEFEEDAKRWRFIRRYLGQLILETDVQNGPNIVIGASINPRLRNVEPESLTREIDRLRAEKEPPREEPES